MPSFQVGGYLENWQAYGSVPGPFNVVYYSFLTLNQRPNPDAPAPIFWNGEAIYESSCAADVLEVMTKTEPAWENPNEWARAKIQPAIDSCRESGVPFMWGIGGWSDLTKTITDAQIPKFVEMCVKLLRLGGDGIDFDWEHLSNFKDADPQLFRQQRAIVGKTISALRMALDEAGMEDKHISYTTRWQCFWTSADASKHANAKSFTSDGECLDTLANMRSVDDVSWINLMIYDAAPYTAFEGVQYFQPEHYREALNAGVAAGVPKGKLVVGFEPGEQAGGGIWEGFDIDFAVTEEVRSKGFGGIFFWAMNDPRTPRLPETPKSETHQWQGSVGANANYIARLAGA